MVILGKKDQFCTIFGQNGQNGENYQKSAWNIFLALTMLTMCKVLGKSNEKNLRKAGTNGKMEERYSQIWLNLGQIWVNFGQNGSFLNLSSKSETVIFSTPETRLKTNSRRNCQNTELNHQNI